MAQDFKSIQSFMREQRIDGWLLYDFRGSNSALATLLPGKRHTTRRALLWIPAAGSATLLAHGLDAAQFRSLDLAIETYVSWADLNAWLKGRLSGCGRVAMEYSPGCSLPVVSMVDAGTVELIRSFGTEVCSSASLIQQTLAVWSPGAVSRHAEASCKVAGIKEAAFDLIRRSHREQKAIDEVAVQKFIQSRFAAEGLEWPDGPIVAVNAHSGDPHYEPTAATSSPIRPGDWVLIDLWARVPGNENIFSDITWVGFAGKSVPARHQQVFEAVRASRDRAVEVVREAWKRSERVQGWQVDEAARHVIIEAGFADAIRHRTGHSLSPGEKVHGVGANLDNLETHDTRELLAGLGFTVEPGIYLADFGVRLEINVYMDPQKGPVVTSALQDEVILMG